MFTLLALSACLAASMALAAEGDGLFAPRDTWQATMRATREQLLAAKPRDPQALAEQLWQRLDEAFPVPSDWMLQDLGPRRNEWFGPEGERALEREWFERLAVELTAADASLRREIAALRQQNPPRSDARWLDTYVRACEARRAARLSNLLVAAPRLVFLKHHNLAGSHYAYTEGQSDAQAERHFRPGAALCVLQMKGLYGEATTLLDDPHGVIRDPDVSHDGRRVLFAWKKSDRLDDYHLYEWDVASGRVRQLTFGLGVADYEPAYLPDGRIIFNSTRCVQIVDCWWTEVSNLYTCDGDGRDLRRLSFDQVHSNYPQVLDDGRIVYTRWEYNDRGQIYPQPLFQMNSDGTNQTEFYGNNSLFPTSILHARGLPGSQQVVAIASGHHSSQAGKLVIIDPARGRQEAAGVQLIAPERATPAVKVDSYGQEGEQWMYPYAMSDREFLVTYMPLGRPNPRDRFSGRYGVYWMDRDGRRELLAADAAISCCQALPLRPRPAPRPRPSLVDYRKDHGVFYLHDIYQGPGLTGVPRGTIRALRVATFDFRAAGIGSNTNTSAMVSTPPSVGNGAWDPKIVLGTTPVHEDGSAMFEAPARMPIYFQALDADGQMVQTMRSWSTLQPGETASCVGCHEEKNQSPPSYVADSQAMRGGPKKLDPFYGPTRGFSFPKEIQPILDRHCVGCHRDRSRLGWLEGDEAISPPAAMPGDVAAEGDGPIFAAKTPQFDGSILGAAKIGTVPRKLAVSLLAETTLDASAKRHWSDSYLVLTGAQRRDKKRPGAFIADWNKPLVNWPGAQTMPPMLPPYSYGAAKSQLITMLREGHEGAKLSKEELDKIVCWIDLAVPYCGDYREANAWTPDEHAKYDAFLTKRERLDAYELRSVARHVDKKNVPAAAPSAELTIEVLDADGRRVQQAAGAATPERPLSLELKRAWQTGDRVRISRTESQGAGHVAISLDAALGESLVYAPSGPLQFAVPGEALAPRGRPYPPEAFRAERPQIRVRPAARRELDAYRNLAVNRYDVRGESSFFPHASSNSECRGEAVFAARNAIDGFAANRGHGAWPHQSWGPEREKDVAWQVDFGREVQIDKVVVTLRADFPHDKAWRRATLNFVGGPRQAVTLEPTGRPQSFVFRPLKATGMQLTDLVQDEPLGWCAIAEVEVFGRDPLPVADDLEKLGE